MPRVSPIIIHGPSGSGKTTLLRALYNSLVYSTSFPKSQILLIEPATDSNRFPDLQRLDSDDCDTENYLRVLLIDDIHKLSGDDSSSFWSVFNKMSRIDGLMVMTSRFHPADMFPENDHLRSRLLSGLVLSLEPPDDNSRITIIENMAMHRGFKVSSEVCAYLVRHKSRSLKELETIIELLDYRSLERKKRITIPLIKEMESQDLI